MKDSRSSVPDFSEQWSAYVRQEGRYASEEMLADYLEPIVKLQDLTGLDVCEVGCGNGRFLPHFARYAASVTGIEPSAAWKNSAAYTSHLPNVRILNVDVYAADCPQQFDIVFCLGVLHHTPDPIETIRRLGRMTKPGGRIVVWVYGREGNGVYLALARALRIVTMRLPHRALHVLSTLLTQPLKAYIGLARVVPVPMRKYMRSVLAHYDDYALKLTIYDQLNPTIAGYWTREHLQEILAGGGLTSIRFHHRHGYSWTASGEAGPP